MRRIMHKTPAPTREPLIALKEVRILGRKYVPGMVIDRRKISLTGNRIRGLIQEGIAHYAKDLDPEVLAEYGLSYNKEDPRAKIKILDPEKVVHKALLYGKFRMTPDISDEDLEETGGGFDGETPETSESPDLIESFEKDGSWYVAINSEIMNEEGFSKEEADSFIQQLSQ